jgi:hypothetical protein
MPECEFCYWFDADTGVCRNTTDKEKECEIEIRTPGRVETISHENLIIDWEKVDEKN